MRTRSLIIAAESDGIGIWDWKILEDRFVCDAWMYRLHGLEFQNVPARWGSGRKICIRMIARLWSRRWTMRSKGARPYETDFRVIWQDGSVHRLKATGQVTRDAAGRAVRMVGTNRDIAE